MKKYVIILSSNIFGGLFKMARRRHLSGNLIMNRNVAKSYMVIGIVLLFFSLAFAWWGFDNYNYAQRAVSEGDSVYATCTNKWSETKTTTHKSKYGSRKKTQHTYYYADAVYTYQGQKYNCTKISVDSSTKVGDNILVYVMPENPSRYVVPGQQYSSFGTIILFIVLAVMGISTISVAVRSLIYINQNGGKLPVSESYDGTINVTYPSYSNNQYNPNNTYQGYDNQYNQNNTYGGQYNPNNTYQGYDNNPNNTYNGYNINNRW